MRVGVLSIYKVTRWDESSRRARTSYQPPFRGCPPAARGELAKTRAVGPHAHGRLALAVDARLWAS